MFSSWGLCDGAMDQRVITAFQATAFELKDSIQIAYDRFSSN